MSFQRMLGQLASAAHDHLKHLVVQLSPRFKLDDVEAAVAQLRGHFRTVTVERIHEIPRMPLPPCCVERNEGPGTSYTWTERFLCMMLMGCLGGVGMQW
ncbi:hypothetical protein V8D89_004106 [Ganoderma adspersum]